MDVGFENAGVKVIVASELVKHAADTYELNHPGVRLFRGDLNLYLDELCEAASGADIVFGGPPCQGFSVAGKMDPNDERSQLIWAFQRVVEKVRPQLFVMENVKALGTLEKWEPIRRTFVENAATMGYHCEFVVLKASDYGVPQNRERVFFIGSRETFNLDDLILRLDQSRNEAPSLRSVFRSLPKAGSEENPITCTAKITLAEKPVMRKSPYAGMLFNGMGRPLNLDAYSYTLPASMGGNKTPIVDETLIWDQDGYDWVKEYHSSLEQADGRVAKEVASSLRRITTVEAAAIQTFPSDYKFSGVKTAVYAQIGNAVPCRLAEVVAECAIDVTLKGVRFNYAAENFGRLW